MTTINYEQFAADLNSPNSVRFHSAEEREEAIRKLGVSDYESRQLGRGSFRTDVASIQTSEGILSSTRFERSVYVPLRPPKGLVFLGNYSSAKGDIMANGEIVTQGRLILQTPETQVDFVAPDLSAADTFGIPVSRFYAMLDAICPGASSIRQGQVAMVTGDTLRLKRLRHAFVDLVTHPELDPRHERQANLITEVIAWLGDSDSRWQPERFAVNGTRRRVARLARDYMEDHFPNPIRLEDLCREAGVSLRTLKRAFSEYFQIPPYEYLKKLRLDRARRELCAGEPGTHSVTTVALTYGYFHLSRFARDYRQAFGELPSETLRRRV